MLRPTALAAALILACACASAQQALVAGTIQKVSYEPRGADDCPDPCPAAAPRADGLVTVCISNMGGCESVELKVEHDVSGQSPRGSLRRFGKQRIGEWGPIFPVTAKPIVIHQHDQGLTWTPAVLRNGQVYVLPNNFKRLWNQDTVEWIKADDPALVPLETEAARLGLAKR